MMQWGIVMLWWWWYNVILHYHQHIMFSSFLLLLLYFLEQYNQCVVNVRVVLQQCVVRGGLSWRCQLDIAITPQEVVDDAVCRVCICVCVFVCVFALLNMPMGKNTVAAGKGSAKMKKRERNRTAENGKTRRREDRCPFWIVLTCSVIILRQSNPVPNPIASQE